MQHFTRTERFLSLFTTLRAGEGRAAQLLCLQAFFLMFSYYLLKVIREPMILAEGSAELKAYTTAMQAILLMLIVPFFARLYQRTSSKEGKHHIFRNTLAFFVLNLFAFALAYKLGLPIAIAFYVWLGIFSVMVLTLFWAFATDLFNLKSGQRIFPLIAASTALGALLGAGSANWLDINLGHAGVMVFSALLLTLPLWLSRHTEKLVPDHSGALSAGTTTTTPYPLMEGFQIVWRSRYLSLIACFVIVLNLINTNGEYILASFVTTEAQSLAGLGAQTPPEAADGFITRFYSQYLFLTTSISFIIQLFLVPRIFDRLGIRGALNILPLLMIASYSLIAFLPMLVVVRAAMVAENSVNYSLQTTTRHALFLPVSREEKYVGKHTIDTFFFRVGDVLSGSFVYLASTVIGLSLVGFVGLNICLASILLWLSRAIGKRHDESVEDNLSNMPPMVHAPLEDLYVKSGVLSHMQLDAQTFIDPDVGDALKYQAYAVHAERLPPWVKFDTLGRKFQFNPPQRSEGCLEIRVVARDFDGLEAEVCFTLNYAPGTPI